LSFLEREAYYPSWFCEPESTPRLTVQAVVENEEIHVRTVGMSYYPLYGMVSVPTVISSPVRELLSLRLLPPIPARTQLMML